MEGKLVAQRTYYATVLDNVARSYREALFPTSYNVATDILGTFSALLTAGKLVSVLKPYRTYIRRRLQGVAQSHELARKNRPFRQQLQRIALEIRNSKHTKDAELEELASQIDVLVLVTGISDRRTIELDGAQVSFVKYFVAASRDAIADYRAVTLRAKAV